MTGALLYAWHDMLDLLASLSPAQFVALIVLLTAVAAMLASVAIMLGGLLCTLADPLGRHAHKRRAAALRRADAKRMEREARELLRCAAREYRGRTWPAPLAADPPPQRERKIADAWHTKGRTP